MQLMEFKKVLNATDLADANLDLCSFKENEFHLSSDMVVCFNNAAAYVTGNIPNDFFIDFALKYHQYFGDNTYCYATDGRKQVVCQRKEVLLSFILEYKDYLLRKAGKKETEVQRYDGLIDSINNSLLVDTIFPFTNKGIKELLDQDKKDDIFARSYPAISYYGEYVPILESNPEEVIDIDLHTAVLEFDKAVNPFMDSDYTEEDIISNFRDKVVLLEQTGLNGFELEIDDRPYDMHLNDNSNDMKFELNNFSPGGTYKVKITVKGLDDTQRTVTKTLAFSEE